MKKWKGKKNMKKAVVSLGIAAVLLLAGLIASSADTFGSDTTETVLDIPEEISYITDVKSMPTGELVLIGGNQMEKTLIKYVSEDEGDTWQKECEYLEKLPVDLSDVEAAEGHGYIADDGYIGICLQTYETYLQHVTAENQRELGTEEFLYIIDPDGNITEVSVPRTGEFVGGFYKVHFAGEKAYFEDIRGNLYQADRDSGKILGKVMEDIDFLFAQGVVSGQELCAVTSEELGYPVDFSFEDEAEDECPVGYSFEADAVKGQKGVYYIADMYGIHIYSRESGKQMIHENSRTDIDRYSDFYDMTVIDDSTVLIDTWNEKTKKEQLIKYEIQR